MTTTMLDLTQQGDVGTITDESKLASVRLMDPQQLYELWEKQNWVSQTIDFTQDKEDWAGFTEEERSNMAWNLSSFFVGEERVTTQFTGLVAAYEDQSEEAFLTTQQVDEARHAQHFNRFYEQVVGYDGTFDKRLERAREDLNDAPCHCGAKGCRGTMYEPEEIARLKRLAREAKRKQTSAKKKKPHRRAA